MRSGVHRSWGRAYSVHKFLAALRREQGAHMDDVLAASARLSDAQTQRQARHANPLPSIAPDPKLRSPKLTQQGMHSCGHFVLTAPGMPSCCQF